MTSSAQMPTTAGEQMPTTPCDECCWTLFCPDHRLRQDNDGSRCRACNGTGRKPV